MARAVYKGIRSPEFCKKISEIKKAQNLKWTPEQREKILKARANTYLKGSKHWNWKGGKFIKEGYVWILTDKYYSTPRHKKRYFQEHRVVMERHIGRQLKKYEEVHHKNGIKTDNRIENLELVVNNKHFGNIQCPFCHQHFKIK